MSLSSATSAISELIKELTMMTRADAGEEIEGADETPWISLDVIAFVEQILHTIHAKGIRLPDALAPYAAGNDKTVAMEWIRKDSDVGFLILTINLPPNNEIEVRNFRQRIRIRQDETKTTDEKANQVVKFLVDSKFLVNEST